MAEPQRRKIDAPGGTEAVAGLVRTLLGEKAADFMWEITPRGIKGKPMRFAAGGEEAPLRETPSTWDVLDQMGLVGMGDIGAAAVKGGKAATRLGAEAARSVAGRVTERERTAPARRLIVTPREAKMAEAAGVKPESAEALRNLVAETERVRQAQVPARYTPEAIPKREGIRHTAARNVGLTPVPKPPILLTPEEAVQESRGMVERHMGGKGRYAAQAEQAETVPGAQDPVARMAARQTLRETTAGRPVTLLRDYYDRGLFGEHWYEGAFPQIQQELKRLEKAAPGRLAGRMEKGDPALVAKYIASTSPQNEPGQNVDYALKAYLTYLSQGRKDINMERAGFMESHARNLERAGRGEPIEGPKVANFVLDIFGSQVHPTIDRWMVEVLTGVQSQKAQIEPWVYHEAADQLRQLATAWGTTPVRAQAALWSGYKILHDPRMYEMMKGGVRDEQIVPSLATHIKGGADRTIQMLRDAGGTFTPKMLSLVPIIGMASLLLEDAGKGSAEGPAAAGPEGGARP